MKDFVLVVIIALLTTECDCSRTILVKQFILTPSAASNQKLVLDPTQIPTQCNKTCSDFTQTLNISENSDDPWLLLQNKIKSN